MKFNFGYQKTKFSIDVATSRQISGWVWSPRNPRNRIEIELLEAGRVVRTVIANHFRQDLKDAQVGDGAHAFCFGFPEEICDGQLRTLHLRVRGAKKPFYSLPPMKLAVLVDFHIDAVTHHQITGWAWLPGVPQQRLHIEFAEGGSVLGSVMAADFRPDLRTVGKGDGHCAFAFPLPPQLLDGNSHAVELRIQGGSDPFHRLPERVYGQILGEVEVGRAKRQAPGPRLPLALNRVELPSITSPAWGGRRRTNLLQTNTTQSPDVSIVLNVHREASYLQRTLLSLVEAVEYARQRSELTFELIVVLDNSDDRTRRWAEPQRFADFDAFKIIEVSNGSLGLSRNSGIAVANGKYVTTCDADDLISFNMFYELFDIAQKHGGDVAVFPEYLLAFGDTSHLCKYFDSRFVPTLAYFDYHPYISRVFIPTDYARAHPYKHADHRKDYAYEDWHFTSELVAAGIPLLVAPNTTLFYRQRAGSLLREANATSSRLVHPNRLLEPSRFIALTDEWSDIVPNGEWSPPSVTIIREEFFENPATQASAYYANKIDPAVGYSPEPLTSIFSNLHGQGVMGLAYRTACLQLLQRDYTDVVVLPFLTTGGGEKYILSLLEELVENHAGERFLFLSGEAFETHSWLDLLPPKSDFLDLHQICGGDENVIDVVTLRLIQYAGKAMRVHLKASGYTHRFLSKFGRLIQDNEVIYYRFCDEMYVSQGDIWREGSAFQSISENIGYIHRFISDHQALVESDRQLFSTFEERWQCIYTKCELPTRAWIQPSREARIKLLWASRISSQKRPQLVLRIADKLKEQMPNVEIDVYGRCDPGQDVSSIQARANLTYLGPYKNFFDIDLSGYTAFLYTSHFDGLPNVVLEAMAAGMPVVAPNVGGIPEAVVHRETGWIVDATGDDDADAQAYVDTIREMVSAASSISDVGASARALIAERHSRAAFGKRVADVFANKS